MNIQDVRHEARRRLDRRFVAVDVAAACAQPPRGWSRAVRDALGMNARQLGERLGISHASVIEFERSERHGVVKLDTLRRAADAMNCDFVYAFVPRTSLQQTVEQQARKVAQASLRRTDRTMRLEQQGIPDEALQDHLNVLTGHLMETGRIWDTEP